MNTTKHHDMKTLSREMYLSGCFDGPIMWNTATAVARVYVPATRRARLVRWLAA